jgi:ABC-type branched-subunit amino acid transport system substrate-binding protein
MDWAVDDAGKAKKVRAAIIYQQDDYGKDGLEGWRAAAKRHGVKIVLEYAIKPGQKSMKAEIGLLKRKRATHVYLAVLPSATAPLLGTAFKKLKRVKWIGATPSWLDAFFAHPKLPAPIFKNFHWVEGLPYWGEDVPGMQDFLKVFKKYGGKAMPDFYLLMSYVQGLMSIEAAKRAIEAGDLTREGYLKALRGMKEWSAAGLIQPLDMSATPYVVGTKTRILKPDFKKKTWSVVADYASPSTEK